MEIICLDLEGVITPEIWVNVAEKTGIQELKATTRDVPDYNVLMKQRLQLMRKNKLDLSTIQNVINHLDPLDGALEFLNELHKHFQVIILSDTFYEFAEPFMEKLGRPTLFCHRLEINVNNQILDYHLRIPDHKRKAVESFHELNFTVYAAGDSYNDTSMLAEADNGFLFNAPENVVREFPQYPAINTYGKLLSEFKRTSSRFL